MKKRTRNLSVLAGILAVVMVLGLVMNVLPHAQAASSSEIKEQIGRAHV